MFETSDCPTVLVSEAELAAVYQEARERANRPRTEEHTLFRPAIPVVTDSPESAEWLAKVAAVWDWGGHP
jgi:hypothetical protein